MTIDDKGRYVHHAISVFWILNSKLSPSKRFVYVPMPAYKDKYNYCLLSEKQFPESVLRIKRARGFGASWSRPITTDMLAWRALKTIFAIPA